MSEKTSSTPTSTVGNTFIIWLLPLAGFLGILGQVPLLNIAIALIIMLATLFAGNSNQNQKDQAVESFMMHVTVTVAAIIIFFIGLPPILDVEGLGALGILAVWVMTLIAFQAVITIGLAIWAAIATKDGKSFSFPAFITPFSPARKRIKVQKDND